MTGINFINLYVNTELGLEREVDYAPLIFRVICLLACLVCLLLIDSMPPVRVVGLGRKKLLLAGSLPISLALFCFQLLVWLKAEANVSVPPVCCLIEHNRPPWHC